MPASPSNSTVTRTIALLATAWTLGCPRDAYAAGEPCGIVSMVFRLTSASAAASAIQFRVDYSTAGGGFVGTGGSVDCHSMTPSLSSGNDDETAQTLTLAQIFPGGAGAPRDLWQCSYNTTGIAPAADDFAITIVDASGTSGQPITIAVEISQMSCVPVCDAAPRGDCRAAAGSRLAIKDKDDDTKDTLAWKWRKGSAFAMSDISDPTTTGSYSLCLYADSMDLQGEVSLPSGGRWERSGSTGYKYKDRTATFAGVVSVKLKSGAVTKTSVSLKAEGVNIADTLLPATSYTVQFIDRLKDACWTSTFSSGGNKTGEFSGHFPDSRSRE